MNMHAYIRVVGTEEKIHAINREANLSTARILELKAPRDTGKWWNWELGKTSIDLDNVDDGLRALLLRYRAIFPIIRNHADSEMDIYLEVVSYYQENEEPQGLYLSTETIQLMYELGAALDSDVVINVPAK